MMHMLLQIFCLVGVTSAVRVICDPPCRNGGRCLFGMCHCARDWAGPRCASKVLSVTFCETKTGYIGCQAAGEVVQILTGDYGRRSDKICTQRGFINTNCGNVLRTTQILHRECYNKRYCVISATNSRFGDTCPGSFKYLTVKFWCNQQALWGEWTPYSECSTSCGGGNRFRTRTCRSERRSSCLGKAREDIFCNVQKCGDLAETTTSTPEKITTNGAHATTPTRRVPVAGRAVSFFRRFNATCPNSRTQAFQTIPGMSMESCEKACLGWLHCRGFEFDPLRRVCYFHRRVCSRREMVSSSLPAFSPVTLAKRDPEGFRCGLGECMSCKWFPKFTCHKASEDTYFLRRPTNQETYFNCAMECAREPSCLSFQYGPAWYDMYTANLYLNCYLFSRQYCAGYMSSFNSLYCYDAKKL